MSMTTRLNPLQKRLAVTKARPSWLKDCLRMKMIRGHDFSGDREVDNTGEFALKIRAKLHGMNNPRAGRSDVA